MEMDLEMDDVARDLLDADEEEEFDLPEEESEIEAEHPVEDDGWDEDGEPITRATGRAVSAPLYGRARINPECVGLRILYREPGAQDQALGILATNGTEADLIRQWPDAMPQPGEGYRTFIIQPVNARGSTMGAEVEFPVNEHHQVVAQIRKVKAMARRAGVSEEEAEALLAGRLGAAAGRAGNMGDMPGFMQIIGILREDRSAEQQRQRDEYDELREMRKQAGDERSAAAAAREEASAATVTVMRDFMQEGRERDQAQAATTAEMTQTLAKTQITAAQESARLQLEMQQKTGEQTQGFMSSQMQLLMAQQATALEQSRLDAREREAERKLAFEQDRERRKDERDERERREERDAIRREKQESDQKEKDRQWMITQQTRETQALEAERNRMAESRAADAARAEREERDRKEAADAREKDRVRAHEMEMKRIETEREAARVHTQSLTALQLAGTQREKSEGILAKVTAATGVLTALGVDTGDLFGGLLRRVVSPAAPVEAGSGGEGLKMLGNAMEHVADVVKAGVVAKAGAAASVAKTAAETATAARQLTMLDDDDDDWDIDDLIDEEEEEEPEAVVAAPVYSPPQQAPPLPVPAPPAQSTQAPPPQNDPGIGKLVGLIKNMQDKDEVVWEVLIMETFAVDLGLLNTIQAMGLRAIVTQAGADNAFYDKLCEKLRKNILIPDDFRYE
jgi:hypothetical protein